MMSYVQDSLSLDLAHLNRGVPAIIDKLAQNAIQEVEDARHQDDPATAGSDAGEGT